MQSLKKLYKIGIGPSSSHTMGPQYAAEYVNENYPEADFVKVILYGSLALTGEGHGTHTALSSTLKARNEIVFNTELQELPHPNTLDFVIFDKDGNEISKAQANGQILPRTKSVLKYTAKVLNPKLWDCENPNLYNIETKILKGDTVIDTDTTHIGFRTIELDPQKGFLLNGKKCL